MGRSIWRYLQPDPLSLLRPMTGAYHYATNNPLRFADPLGLYFVASDPAVNDTIAELKNDPTIGAAIQDLENDPAPIFVDVTPGVPTGGHVQCTSSGCYVQVDPGLAGDPLDVVLAHEFGHIWDDAYGQNGDDENTARLFEDARRGGPRKGCP